MPSVRGALIFAGVVVFGGVVLMTTLSTPDQLTFGRLFPIGDRRAVARPARRLRRADLALPAELRRHRRPRVRPPRARAATRSRSCGRCSSPPRSAALIALPALRLSGIYLALGTAAFAVILDKWICHAPEVRCLRSVRRRPLHPGLDQRRPAPRSSAPRTPIPGSRWSSARVAFALVSLVVIAIRRGRLGSAADRDEGQRGRVRHARHEPVRHEAPRLRDLGRHRRARWRALRHAAHLDPGRQLRPREQPAGVRARRSSAASARSAARCSRASPSTWCCRSSPPSGRDRSGGSGCCRAVPASGSAGTPTARSTTCGRASRRSASSPSSLLVMTLALVAAYGLRLADAIDNWTFVAVPRSSSRSSRRSSRRCRLQPPSSARVRRIDERARSRRPLEWVGIDRPWTDDDVQRARPVPRHERERMGAQWRCSRLTPRPSASAATSRSTRRPRGRARRGHGPHRPERRGQDHAVQRDHRPAPAEPGPRPARRQRRDPPLPHEAGPARPRPHVPAPRAVQPPERPREHPGRRRRPQGLVARQGRPGRRRRGHHRARRAAGGRRRTRSTRSPPASAGWSSSAAASPPSRRCCCSTSRRRVRTRARRSSSRSCSGRSRPTAWRWCSSSTTCALVMEVCATVHVLDFGRDHRAAAPRREIQTDEAVLAAYLGSEHVNLLELRGVRAAYDRIDVLFGIDLEVPEGSVVALLGPNGAGKTTTLRVAAGLHPPSAGDVLVAGRRVNGTAPEELARRGLCLIPEGRGIFPNLTVRENLRMMTYSGTSLGDDRGRGVRRASPASRSGGSRSPGRCPAASSRCSRWPAAWPPTRPCSCSTSCRWASRRSSSRSSTGSWPRSHALGVSILVVEQFASTVLGVADLAAVLVHGRVARVGTPARVAGRIVEGVPRRRAAVRPGVTQR